MHSNIAYHILLRAKDSRKDIDLKNDILTEKVSEILKDNNCHEYCLGVRFDQLNMLISLNPDIALNDLLAKILSQTEALIKNELKIKGFVGWTDDHIIYTHSTNFMRHIVDFIKADDEDYQEERKAREAEFYYRAKRCCLFDDKDPMFDDLIMLDMEESR
ncbi:MAG: hypothetical protein WCT23_05795 [Candidatus Neomarinimicrobiota bacterium]